MGCRPLSSDLIGSMSSPQCGELRKPSRSYERGRKPIDPKRATLSKTAPLNPYVEVGSCDRERSVQSNVTVTRTCFSGVVTAARSFSLKSVTFLLEWFVMMIEKPKRSFYILMKPERFSLRENRNFEASRTIAGALTRLWLRCVCLLGARKRP